MIVNVDARGLEVVCAAFLSQDKTLMKELWDGVDIHGSNQKAFGLPAGKAGRLIAKILKFRILYGGTEYSFAQDPDFTGVSSSPKYWKRVIDKYYEKYKGLAEWHTKLLQTVTTTGQLTMCTGREYKFSILPNGNWPVTQIKNFPVQGFGADVMAIIRVAFYKRFTSRKIEGKIIMTVHDSIVVDCPDSSVLQVIELFEEVFRDFPRLFKQWFGITFNLELHSEISFGNNMNDLWEYNVNTFNDDMCWFNYCKGK